MRNSLTKNQVKDTKKKSILDGCLFNMMDGFGGQYVIPYALKLGATNTQISLISAFPTFLGSISQILSAKITEKVKSRKKMIALFALLQGLSLIPLFMVPFFTKNILWLTFFFTLYILLDQMIIPAWNSLMGDSIPQKDRVEFFGRRNRFTMFTLVGSIIVAGTILHEFEKTNVWLGFWILFSIAMFSRVACAIVQIKYYEPKNTPPKKENLSFGKFFTHIRENNFGRYVMFRSALTFAVMVAGPFFAVYVLKVLEFNYLQYSATILTGLVTRAIVAPYWANQTKKYSVKQLISVTSIMVATVPLVWFTLGSIFGKTDAIFYMILLAEIWGGFAWSGFDLMCYNYLLNSTNHDNRPRLFSYFHAVFGFFYLLGGLISAQIVNYVPNLNLGINPVLAVIFASFIARLAAVAIFLPGMEGVHHKKVNRANLVFELAISKPMSVGMHSAMSIYSHFEHDVEKTANTGERKIEKEIKRFNSKVPPKPLKTRKQKKNKKR